jgi:acyl-CoA synthetase (AMP-forming)/AMP-acid ligase II
MTALSLASVLAEPARRRPDATALVEGATRLSYDELWRGARAVAATLADLGTGPGDRVALLAPNVADFVRCYYGIIAAGGVVVPVPTLLTGREAAQIVSDSGAGLLLYHGQFAEVATAAARSAGIQARDVAGLGEGKPPFGTFVTRQAEDLAVIFYTSGTTGAPKGAMLTHLNLVMNATVNAFDSNGLAADDVVMGALPLFHTFGQSAAMNSAFRVGATLVLQPRFDAAAALELMAAEGVTRFLGVPTMFIQLLRAAGGAARLPRLTSCTSGGAALPVAVLEEFEEFEQAFGTTSAPRTPTASSRSSTAARTSSSGPASTSTRGRSRRFWSATPTSARSRSSACPTPSAARRSAPSSCHGPATRSTPMNYSRGDGSDSPGTSTRGSSACCPNCPSARRRRYSSGTAPAVLLPAVAGAGPGRSVTKFCPWGKMRR